MEPAIFNLLFTLSQISFIFASPLIKPNKCIITDSLCMTALSQALVPAITAELPNAGTERLDPMFIKSLHIDKDGLKLDWKNIYLHGLKNTIIDKVSVDLDTKLIQLVFRTNYSMIAEYKAEGNLLTMPLNGEGIVFSKYDNFQTEAVIPFQIVKDLNGRDILDLKSFQYRYDVKGPTVMLFDNLFDGNLVLGQKLNSFINQNWKIITVQYGRYLYDQSNEKIFNAIRTYLLSNPLGPVVVYQ